MAAATPAAAPDGSGSSGGGEEGDVLEGLEGLMAQLGAGGAPGEAAEGVDGFVQNMMASLLSKEVLYQSLKVGANRWGQGLGGLGDLGGASVGRRAVDHGAETASGRTPLCHS